MRCECQAVGGREGLPSKLITAARSMPRQPPRPSNAPQMQRCHPASSTLSPALLRPGHTSAPCTPSQPGRTLERGADAALRLHNLGAQLVQELAVVRHNDHGDLLLLQVACGQGRAGGRSGAAGGEFSWAVLQR